MEDLQNDINTISTISDCSNSDFEETIELIRIFSELSIPERQPFIDTITDDEMMEITSTVYELTDEYVKQHILSFHEQNFHKQMEHEITEYIFENFSCKKSR